MTNNANRIIKGSFWTTFSTFATAGVQMLRIAILTRYIEASAFGLIAILTLIVGMTNTFADLGFSAAIMHKKDISRADFSSLYWIQFSLYGLLYFVVCGFAIPISSFYHLPELRELIPLIMLDLVFYGLGRLYDTLLLKQFQYKLIALRNIVCCLLSLVLAVILAYMGYGVYSLVISTLSHSLLLNLWNFVAGQKIIAIKAEYDIKSNIGLIKIGLYQTGTQILDYFSSKLDILILGKLLNTSDLGFYSLAKELVIKALNIANGIINRVFLPIFAQIQEDISRVQRYYCLLLEAIGLINFFVLLLIGVFAPQIVNTLYGEAYSVIIPILMVLSIWGLLICIGNPTGNLVVAFGKTDKSFRYTIVRILITIPVIWTMSKYGLMALSLGQVVLSVLLIQLIYYMILKPVIHIKWTMWARSFFPMLIVTTIMMIIGYRINVLISMNDIPGYWLVLLAISLVAVYVLIAFKLYKNIIDEFFTPIFLRLSRRICITRR